MDTDTIDRLTEDEVPYLELDEMAAEDYGRCCRVIPCLHPEECPR